MLEQTDIPVRVLIGGGTVCSQTRATGVGAYVLVLDTVLGDHGVELHSTYMGHEDTATIASHLLLAPGHKETVAVEHDHGSIPVTHARRRCLYDHLQYLQDLLREAGVEAAIPVDEVSVAAVEH